METMKKLFPCLTMILSLTNAHEKVKAQWMSSDTITFESKNNLISIDTSQSNNIFQIGKPQKIFFDSAYSNPKAIVTDTSNPYPINNLSSFQFVIKPPGPSVWQFSYPVLYFYHKYDTDSLKDGGYIESSWDGGATWTNLANDPYVYVFNNVLNDTIQGGIHAFTGKSYSSYHNWQYVRLEWWRWCWAGGNPPPTYPDSIIVRFSFKSDGIQTNKEGWLIDNIFFGTGGCPIGIHEILSNGRLDISPNPLSAQTVLHAANSLHNASLTLYNSFGQSVKQINNISGQTITLQRDYLASGLYFIRLTECDKLIATDKLVITDR